MARGRFISKDIIGDKEVNELSTDTCRLAYIYLITLADCEGRIIGDPDYLASMLFPRRREVTPDMIRSFVGEWAEAGFIVYYETAAGEKIIQLINWEKHQKGLRKDREAPSNFPDPKECNVIQVKNNLKESKLREVKGSPPTNSGVNTDKIGNKENKPISSSFYPSPNPETFDENENPAPPPDLFHECQKIYETKKGYLVTDGASFSLMIKNFENQGVTAADYAAAIDAMDANPRYNGTKPTSYERWAVGIAQKRNNPDINQKEKQKTNKEIIQEMIENGEI